METTVSVNYRWNRSIFPFEIPGSADYHGGDPAAAFGIKMSNRDLLDASFG
jgi:hypothetical protein